MLFRGFLAFPLWSPFILLLKRWSDIDHVLCIYENAKQNQQEQFGADFNSIFIHYWCIRRSGDRSRLCSFMYINHCGVLVPSEPKTPGKILPAHKSTWVLLSLCTAEIKLSLCTTHKKRWSSGSVQTSFKVKPILMTGTSLVQTFYSINVNSNIT